MISIILHAIVLNHFPLIFSAQPFSIKQGHSFTKWMSRVDGDAHSFARRHGRMWWLARAVDGSRLGRGGGLSAGSFAGTLGSITHGVQSRAVASLDRTIPDWSR
jgi:hypothetical protein